MTMAGETLIGLDAGTSVIKAVGFDPSGQVVAEASVRNETIVGGRGAVEQSPAAVWAGASACLRALGGKIPDLRRRVLAVGVTGQGDGLWGVGRDDAPAGNALIWLDGRSAAIVAGLSGTGADRAIFRHTGTALSTSLQSAQLAWLQASDDPRLASLEVILHCKDWLHLCMTGIRATDRCEAVNSFGDLGTGTYSADVLQWLGVERLRNLLPPIIDGCSLHHPLTAEAAAATGLASGTPVVLAPPDYVATSVGMGLVDPRERIGCTILGSAGVHLMLLDDPAPLLGRDPCGYCVHAPIAGTYLRMISHMTGGLSVDWFIDNVSAIGRTVFGASPDFAEILGKLETLAAGSAPARVVFHPFLAEAGERAPFIDPCARAQLAGMSQSTTFADVLRAIYEGLGFAARDCYQQMDAVPLVLQVSGGASKSPLMASILASMLGVPASVFGNVEAGSRGAALVAGVSAGAFANLVDAARTWQSGLGKVEHSPDPALRAIYDATFPIYTESYRSMRRTWQDLAARAPAR